jgi:hypothetical protein
MSSPTCISIFTTRFFSGCLAEQRYSHDALTVQGKLVFEDLFNERGPGDAFIAADYPRLTAFA